MIPFQHNSQSSTVAHDSGHFVHFFIVNVLIYQQQNAQQNRRSIQSSIKNRMHNRIDDQFLIYQEQNAQQNR